MHLKKTSKLHNPRINYKFKKKTFKLHNPEYYREIFGRTKIYGVRKEHMTLQEETVVRFLHPVISSFHPMI